MPTITVARLHKLLGEMVSDGMGRRPVCVDKSSFCHPLEKDGAVILDVTECRLEAITMVDDDGYPRINKDGTENTRTVIVLGGDMSGDA